MEHDAAIRSRIGQNTYLALSIVLASLTLAFATNPSVAWAATNPVPQISQPLAPDSAKPAGAAFTLTVNGTGFVSSSTVHWDGAARTTTFLSSSQLTAAIPSSDIAKAGTALVVVINPGPGGGTSNAVFFEIALPATEVSLSGASNPTALNPASVVAADLNADGRQDLAVANEASNSVSILLGNGNGTFQAHVDYTTGPSPEGVAVGDFNRDGKIDLAVANAGENSGGQLVDTVSILLGQGNGAFDAHVDYPTGQLPVRVATGDFNGDGDLDLVVVNELAGTVSILLGNGDGTFQTNVDYGVGLAPMAVVTGDFNRDGKLDLAVANSLSGTISILLGNGDGTFQAALNVPAVVDPVGLATADLNGDDKLDLVAAGLVASSVAVLLGNGDGTFGAADLFATGPYPESVVTGDFNGDGFLDLALPTESNLGSVSVLLGNGNGTFQSAVDFPAGLLPVAIAAGDFNGDGKLDVATADLNAGSVSALLSTTVVLSPSSLTFPSQPLGTTSAAQTVTLTNIGAKSLSISSISTAAPFAETNTCGTSVAVGASCSISVTFTPTTPGTLGGSFSVFDGAVGSPQMASLSGTGTGPWVSLTPGSLNFGSVDVGSVSSPQTVTLANTGNATLNITSISTSGDFVDHSSRCGTTLAPAASCDIDVTFKPTVGGTLTGALSVNDDALGSPQSVSLTGVGLQGGVTFSPTSLAFAVQVANTTSPPQTVTLTNSGNASLSITNISLGGTDPAYFAETNTCGPTLGVGASCTIKVTFTPGGSGNWSAKVSIRDNGPGSPQSVGLTGTGTTVSFSPTSVNFGTVKVGKTSGSKTVTLTNVGALNVTINSVTFTGSDPGDFAQTNTCGSMVRGGASCTFTLTFTPAATGSRSASLSVADSSGGSPQTVSLTGTGD